MAANLFEQVKSLATGDVVNRIAGGIGETPEATQRALTGAAMPAILGGLAQRFSSGAGPSNLMDVIKQHDPDGRLLDNVNSATGQNVGDLQTKGQGLISSLFGPRAEGVADVVAGHSGIRKSSAMSLLSVAGAMILGFLGQKVARGGLDASGLGSMLQGARGELGRIAPPGLASALGVPSFAEPTYAAGAAAPAADTAYRDTARRDAAGGDTARRDIGATPPAAAARRWLPWAIAALVLIAALALFRSFHRPGPVVQRPAATAPTATTPTAPGQNAPAQNAPAAGPGATTATPVAPNIQAPSAPVQLPNGAQLNVPTNSVAYGLANYLGDSTSPAPPRRFTFQDLRFPTAGATLQPESQTAVNDLAAVLQAYPNVNVRIEGFTDNTGSPQANMQLSQNRAEAVRNALVSRGVDANRVQAQGFGQQNPAGNNGSEAGRAQNRRTDLVVTSR